MFTDKQHDNTSQKMSQAEAIALEALAFIANDEDQFGELLALSGLDQGTLRNALTDRHVLAGILGFMLEREPLLLSFCKQNKIDPERPGKAQLVLSGADKDEYFI